MCAFSSYHTRTQHRDYQDVSTTSNPSQPLHARIFEPLNKDTAKCDVFPAANEVGVNGGTELRVSVDFRAKFDALSSGV